MTKKELISQLAKYPDDAEIFIADYDGAAEGGYCIFLGATNKKSIEYFDTAKSRKKFVKKYLLYSDEYFDKKLIVLT